jgi:hypothetical protein
MSHFLTYKAANPVGCIFHIMIDYLLVNKNKKKNYRKNNKYREIEKKVELAVTKNFSWQFVEISIFRCQS